MLSRQIPSLVGSLSLARSISPRTHACTHTHALSPDSLSRWLALSRSLDFSPHARMHTHTPPRSRVRNCCSSARHLSTSARIFSSARLIESEDGRRRERRVGDGPHNLSSKRRSTQPYRLLSPPLRSHRAGTERAGPCNCESTGSSRRNGSKAWLSCAYESRRMKGAPLVWLRPPAADR